MSQRPPCLLPPFSYLLSTTISCCFCAQKKKRENVTSSSPATLFGSLRVRLSSFRVPDQTESRPSSLSHGTEEGGEGGEREKERSEGGRKEREERRGIPSPFLPLPPHRTNAERKQREGRGEQCCQIFSMKKNQQQTKFCPQERKSFHCLFVLLINVQDLSCRKESNLVSFGNHLAALRGSSSTY